MTSEKTHLIVTGVARSGTTALTELLNSHPDICIGIERFKFQFLLHNNYDSALFEKERFFDFQSSDTNLDPDLRPAWAPVYDGLKAKWDAARIVGDKVPDLTPILSDFHDQNPDFKYIYILRNLKDVGLSWQARADRSRDKWPEGKGFTVACEDWSKQMLQLQTLLDTASFKDNVLVLDYDRMFEEEAKTQEALLGFLGLSNSPSFAETYAKHVDFTAKKKPRKVPAPYVKAYKAIDMAPAKKLRQYARHQAAYWASKYSSPPEEE